MPSLISGNALDFLKKAIGENKTIVEVGCYLGGTTCALAEFNKVIAIDPFLPNYDQEVPYNVDPINSMDGIEQAFLAAIRGKNVTWYKEKSEDVLRWWKDEIDGVFIDGNHSEPFVLKDIGWIRFVRMGGVIAFHDCITRRGVRIVVDKYIRGIHEELGTVDDLTIFRKQPGG